MKVQIVMPAINLWHRYSKPAIDSINEAMMRAKSHSIDTRLLFIDNASTDDTKVEAGKLVSELFAHQRNETRWGFQRSVNFGVNDAFERGFDIALVVNNDIVLHPEAIWRLAERFNGGDVGMVTCMDVRGEMQERHISPQLIGLLLAMDKVDVPEAPHPNFSAFALDRHTWETVGEFDELFAPAYFEDNDYHYRMKLAGVPAITFPPAMFFHHGSRTQNEASEDGRPIVPSGLFENARGAFVRKWGGVPGQERWQHPYDDATKGITSVVQKS